ncbi:MAG: transcription-repair coupling factor [Acholeplasmatales bacterium]|nr:transcription-repair coupling factor [Acholeplasmatales bacterium]
MILELENVEKYTKNSGFTLCNLTTNFEVFLIASKFQKENKTIFVILDTLYEAQKYYDKLINMLGVDDVLFYPSDELITSELLVSSIEFKLERNLTIKNILDGKKHIVITNLTGVIRKQMPKEKWLKSSITFKIGDDVNIKELESYLINSGYNRSYLVSKVGEFSIRGSIIDLFPLNRENPIRLDLFDTEIEKIKEFDINTQRSINSINEIEIIPLNEMFYDDNELNIIKDYINSKVEVNDKEREILNNDLDNLENRTNISLLRKYIGLISSETILDFVDKKSIYFINESRLNQAYIKTLDDIYEYNSNIGNAFKDLNYFYDLNEIKNKYKINYLEEFKVPRGKVIDVRDPERFFGNLEALFDYLKNVDKKVIICFKSKERMKLLKEELLERKINYEMLRNQDYNGIFLTLDECSLGVDFYKDNLLILTEEEIYKRVENKIRYKSVFGESKRIKSVDEINVGDYVVHYDYGIGRYLGIEEKTLSGITRDYIKIIFAGNDYLFVPLEKIDSIMHYTGNNTPKLNSLSGTSWARAKERVRNKLKDISDKLIDLYSRRENTEGFAFSKETNMHQEFKDDFVYEETADQEKAIEDVISDMEKTKPMDRLVCGDVGYGKTEVAMRAAFKAIYDNKQVAFLAPTTVLVGQHYNTFVERFNKFGAIIKKISRLTTNKEQEEILRDLKEGKIDIIIGTHRLLSKDIEFKDLGLLIVDEEQRFGVEHKERIKELKINVDSISLTATPIPRTLQMSMIGIKDLSVIETPPKNRYPVQTYVLEYHKTIVKEAIERELSRGGQVFYLHNRVSDIEDVARKIQMLIPYSRVSFAHGRMDKNTLENRIEDFVLRKSNVLICTTIIETGIDIPNANTLIVDDATRLGLSQLYQLRGRVGRSDRIAYAYLFYDEDKKLTPEAVERLQAIRDFTELGSGFKIAKRDLAIRGSGDILGAEQSGFIDSVGYDMYMRILKETIDEKNGVKKKEDTITPVFSNRHIPKEYINDDGVRIDIHKKIDSIKKIADIIVLEEELKDRFGSISEDIKIYMFEKVMDSYLAKLEANITEKTNDHVKVTFGENINGTNVFKASMQYTTEIKITYTRNKLHVIFYINKLKENWIMEVSKFLERLDNL